MIKNKAIRAEKQRYAGKDIGKKLSISRSYQHFSQSKQ
jgi:hypothetical protein